MDFAYLVTAQVERTEGKFAARDELEEQITDALEGADPNSLEGGEGGQYEVTDWSVEEYVPPETLTPVERAAVAAFLSGIVNDGLDTYGLSGPEKAAVRRAVPKMVRGRS